AFIEAFGRRAFRRPLTSEEREIFATLFVETNASQSFDSAIEFVIEAALESPQFLYRIATLDENEPSVVPLSDLSLASRLSYFMWRSMPDETLLAAAEAGQLSTPAELVALAGGMLAAP